MSEEEAMKEIENYLDYEGSVSIQAIAILYTAYNKEKEKNKEAINYCKRDLAFKRRLEKAKDTIDNYNVGRFDTSESILNILEE